MIHNALPYVCLLPGIPVAVVVLQNQLPAVVEKAALAHLSASLPALVEMKFRERVVLVASAYGQQAQRQQAKRPWCVPSVLLAQTTIVRSLCGAKTNVLGAGPKASAAPNLSR